MSCKYCYFLMMESTPECHRYPPIGGWPAVNPHTHWCGEFRPLADDAETRAQKEARRDIAYANWKMPDTGGEQ